MHKYLKTAVALALAPAATSAFADAVIDNCWRPWRFRDYVFRAVQPQEKDALMQQCFLSASAAAEAVKSIATPRINGTTQLGDVTTTTVIQWQGCSGGADERYEPSGNPTMSCGYQVKEHTSSPRGTTDSVTDSRLVLVQVCGDFDGTAYVPSKASCKPVVSRLFHFDPPSCKGNPIQPLEGLKSQPEPILSWGRGHVLRAMYAPLLSQLGSTLDERGLESFGPAWFSNLHKAVAAETAGWTGRLMQYQYQRGDGIWKPFKVSGFRPAAAAEIDPPPQQITSPTAGWRYFDVRAGAMEEYANVSASSLDARLTQIAYIDGRRLTYGYATVLVGPQFEGTKVVLKSITDESGRVVSFDYEPRPEVPYGMRIRKATDPAGREFLFTYGLGSALTGIQWPDGQVKQFGYTLADRPLALTSTIDEKGDTLGTYTYDTDGRAISTRSGTNGQVWRASWPSTPPQWSYSKYYEPADDVVYRDVVMPQATRADLSGPDGRATSLTSAVPHWGPW